MDQGLHRPQPLPHRLRDLIVGQPLKVTQRQRSLKPFGQLAERRVQRRVSPHRFFTFELYRRFVFREYNPIHRRFPILTAPGPWVALTFAPVHPQFVGGNLVQPGAKCGFVPVFRQPAQRIEKGVRGQVFGNGQIQGAMEQVVQNRLVMRFIKLPERRRITPLGALDDLALKGIFLPAP